MITLIFHHLHGLVICRIIEAIRAELAWFGLHARIIVK